jgi:hypothetical protein
MNPGNLTGWGIFPMGPDKRSNVAQKYRGMRSHGVISDCILLPHDMSGNISKLRVGNWNELLRAEEEPEHFPAHIL